MRPAPSACAAPSGWGGAFGPALCRCLFLPAPRAVWALLRLLGDAETVTWGDHDGWAHPYTDGMRGPTGCVFGGVMTSRTLVAGVAVVATVALVNMAPAEARDRPFSTFRMVVRPVLDPGAGGITTGGGGQFSKVAIERYRCTVAAGAGYGTPAGARDISCNDTEPYRQDFNPDNELAIAVNPKVPTHHLAGSHDYF